LEALLGFGAETHDRAATVSGRLTSQSQQEGRVVSTAALSASPAAIISSVESQIAHKLGITNAQATEKFKLQPILKIVHAGQYGP
jgi:hypothetical protein